MIKNNILVIPITLLALLMTFTIVNAYGSIILSPGSVRVTCADGSVLCKMPMVINILNSDLKYKAVLNGKPAISGQAGSGSWAPMYTYFTVVAPSELAVKKPDTVKLEIRNLPKGYPAGNWSVLARLPYNLVDSNGKTIISATATLQVTVIVPARPELTLTNWGPYPASGMEYGYVFNNPNICNAFFVDAFLRNTGNVKIDRAYIALHGINSYFITKPGAGGIITLSNFNDLVRAHWLVVHIAPAGFFDIIINLTNNVPGITMGAGVQPSYRITCSPSHTALQTYIKPGETPSPTPTATPTP